MTLTLITGNPDKAKATQKYASFPLEHESVDLPEIQSLDPVEIVKGKAEYAFAQLQKPVLVEDTSLVFPFYGRLPGTFIKWFQQEIEVEGLARLADADPERKAVARIVYGLHDGKEVHIFEMSVEGTVSDHPRGTNGFGWDSIFIPAGESMTYAEMTPDQKGEHSPRAKVLPIIATWIESHT